VGDNPLNMASTILGLNAYMLTGEEKYRTWVLDYVGAWKQRTQETGGNIPTNVGLNGKPGGECPQCSRDVSALVKLVLECLLILKLNHVSADILVEIGEA
jgi:hypothetical protein